MYLEKGIKITFLICKYYVLALYIFLREKIKCNIFTLYIFLREMFKCNAFT